MDKEKKKLIMVAVTVGVFLVIIISVSILIFTPKPQAGGVAFSSAHPVGVGQPATMDSYDTVKNFSDVQGIQTPPETSVVQGSDFHINGGDTSVGTSESAAPQVTINVPRPTTAAVPDVPVESLPRTPVKSSALAVPAAPAKTSAPKTAAPKDAASSSTDLRNKSAPAQSKHNDFWVQTGAFTAKVRAEGVKETLAEKGITSIIENREVDGKTWYRVRVGPYTSETEANYWLALVKSIDGFADSQVRQTVSMR